jgi:hypothetical protein
MESGSLYLLMKSGKPSRTFGDTGILVSPVEEALYQATGTGDAGPVVCHKSGITRCTKQCNLLLQPASRTGDTTVSSASAGSLARQIMSMATFDNIGIHICGILAFSKRRFQFTEETHAKFGWGGETTLLKADI